MFFSKLSPIKTVKFLFSIKFFLRLISPVNPFIRILELTNSNLEERHFFEKILKLSRSERRVHIQLTYNDSKTWKSYIAVRDYLKGNKEIVKEYVKIKREAIKYAKGEGKKYREYKKPFLDKIEKVALAKIKDK